MPFEIERKFLVLSDNYKKEAFKKTSVRQGYLSSAPERVVRVRVKGGKGFLTIKGASDESGVSRYEWEKEITFSDAGELLNLCEPGVIDKIRYEIKCGEFKFEVDEFYGENEGLVIAEIELPHKNTVFERPEWLGKEVTGDKRYYNAYLSSSPFKNWKEKS